MNTRSHKYCGINKKYWENRKHPNLKMLGGNIGFELENGTYCFKGYIGYFGGDVLNTLNATPFPYFKDASNPTEEELLMLEIIDNKIYQEYKTLRKEFIGCD